MSSATGASVYDNVQTGGDAKDEDLDQVVDRYAPLVKRIAHHLLLRMPASVQIDDLIQSGMIGLLEAARKYDVSKGASFETYAVLISKDRGREETTTEGFNSFVPRRSEATDAKHSAVR